MTASYLNELDLAMILSQRFHLIVEELHHSLAKHIKILADLNANTASACLRCNLKTHVAKT